MSKHTSEETLKKSWGAYQYVGLAKNEVAHDFGNMVWQGSAAVVSIPFEQKFKQTERNSGGN